MTYKEAKLHPYKHDNTKRYSTAAMYKYYYEGNTSEENKEFFIKRCRFEFMRGHRRSEPWPIPTRHIDPVTPIYRLAFMQGWIRQQTWETFWSELELEITV